MIVTFRAEWRKLWTVRSTYVITGLVLTLISLSAFYIQGYKYFPLPGQPTNNFLASSLNITSATIGAFCAFAGLLLMAHEFRYNTIVYTLTASNSRTKVLLAKFMVIFAYIFGLVLACDVLTLGLMLLGAQLAGHNVGPQNISLVGYFAKSLFYCEGLGLLGLMLASLIRNLTATIGVLFILPNIVEGSLSILLKNNQYYLPFHALERVVSPDVVRPSGASPLPVWVPSASKGAVIFLVYFVVGWLITYYWFLRRDAN